MLKTTRWLAVCALALGACSVAGAQQEQDAPDQQRRQRQNQDRQRPGQDQAAAQDEDEFLQGLNLTQEQRQQIQQINQKHQQQFNQLLRRFQRTHMRAVRLESALLAAVEGGMSDSEKQQFREKIRQQRETQDVSREGAGRREALRPARQGAESDSERNRNQQDDSQPLQPQRSDENSSQADSEDRRQAQTGNQRERAQGQQDRQGRFGQSDRAQGERGLRGGGRQDHSQVEGVLVIITAPDTSNAGLSAQQQQQAQQVSQKYQQTLRQTWRRLHALHHEMVALQSQKLQEIEQVLTEEQMREAHQLRQQGPPPEDDREGRSFDRQGQRQNRGQRESGAQQDRQRDNE